MKVSDMRFARLFFFFIRISFSFCQFLCIFWINFLFSGLVKSGWVYLCFHSVLIWLFDWKICPYQSDLICNYPTCDESFLDWCEKVSESLSKKKGEWKLNTYSLHSLLIVPFPKLKYSQMIVLFALDKDYGNKYHQ